MFQNIFWDTKNLQAPIFTFQSTTYNEYRIKTMCFSPDNSYLIIAFHKEKNLILDFSAKGILKRISALGVAELSKAERKLYGAD